MHHVSRTARLLAALVVIGQLGCSGRSNGGGAGGRGATGIAGNGCAGGTCLNPTCKALGAPASIGNFAEIGFERQPSYIPGDVVIPTFDDVPDRPYTAADGARFSNFGDGDWTRKMLDFFDAADLHVDFFINTSNFCDVAKNPGCRRTIARMLASHNVGNHTVHHIHMGSTLPHDGTDMFNNGCGAAGSCIVCDDEVTGVESYVSALSEGTLPHLTRFRAPYGEPFQMGGDSLPLVRSVVAKHAVHVGWAMESTDAEHDADHLPGSFFADKIHSAVGGGPGERAWGIILMHGTYPWSLSEVKLLLDPAAASSLQHRGFRLGTVEDAICWKCGKHSWEIVQQLGGQARGPN